MPDQIFLFLFLPKGNGLVDFVQLLFQLLRGFRGPGNARMLQPALLHPTVFLDVKILQG